MTADLSIESTFKLNAGNKLPILGSGVWASPNVVTTQSCLEAFIVGYRHIDGAQVYGNEKEVGEALKKSRLNREDVFVTSKILSPGVDVDATYKKCIESVEKMSGGSGYLDLMLVHNVIGGAEGIKIIWQAMEKAQGEGNFKSIGVSNFGSGHIEKMKEYAKFWPPAVNQLELHPWCQQREIVEYCHKNRIAVEAYCPLVRNQKADDPTLNSIAKKHSKTTAQVLLRYCLQKAWSPQPKSDNRGQIAQNADLYDFQLDKEDMSQLDSQDQGNKGALVVAASNE